MKLCPRCGELASFNSHFGAYICSNCTWKDDSYDQVRVSKHNSNSQEKHSITEPKYSPYTYR